MLSHSSPTAPPQLPHSSPNHGGASGTLERSERAKRLTRRPQLHSYPNHRGASEARERSERAKRLTLLPQLPHGCATALPQLSNGSPTALPQLFHSSLTCTDSSLTLPANVFTCSHSSQTFNALPVHMLRQVYCGPHCCCYLQRFWHIVTLWLMFYCMYCKRGGSPRGDSHCRIGLGRNVADDGRRSDIVRRGPLHMEKLNEI